MSPKAKTAKCKGLLSTHGNVLPDTFVLLASEKPLGLWCTITPHLVAIDGELERSYGLVFEVGPNARGQRAFVVEPKTREEALNIYARMEFCHVRQSEAFPSYVAGEPQQEGTAKCPVSP